MHNRILFFIAVGIFIIGFLSCEYQYIKPFPEEIIIEPIDTTAVIPPIDTSKVVPVDTTKVIPGDTTKVVPVDTTKVIPVDTTIVVPPTPKETVFFAKEILPVLTSKCGACHTTKKPVMTKDKAYASLVNGGYVDTKDPASSKLIKKINEGHPTASTLTNAQKKLILTWVTEGAKNN